MEGRAILVGSVYANSSSIDSLSSKIRVTFLPGTKWGTFFKRKYVSCFRQI